MIHSAQPTAAPISNTAVDRPGTVKSTCIPVIRNLEGRTNSTLRAIATARAAPASHFRFTFFARHLSHRICAAGAMNSFPHAHSFRINTSPFGVMTFLTGRISGKNGLLMGMGA
jgi:hypothetical protein